jgi:hypothetical protein
MNLTVLSIILILTLINIQGTPVTAELITWNEEWNYSKEIIIPIKTEIQAAKYQPIDINIDFENLCWAKNEIEHSIRVCCWDGNTWNELESQIYDLQSIDNNFIKSCSIVFLIPEFADGNEKYFVYYSDSEKDPPNYKDHVQIEESYYHYEPISGYALESSYFKITDRGFCNYIVSKEGRFLDYNTGQHITKMNENTIDIKPKNGDTIASFDFKYSYGVDLFEDSSTSQKLISKEIFNDGNLMIEFGMISRSKLDDLQTTAHYKYYHCPTSSQSRIHVHVIHEALKEISLDKTIVLETNTDGTYASIQAQSVKSKTIDDLNLGKIYPFLHYTNEIGIISEFDVDIDPEYIPEDLETRIISIIDDVDLGEKSWFSFDEGESGKVHAIIFYSNNVLRQGSNERDGIQINSFEMDYPHLPGLENNMANIVVSRNSYEKDDALDTIIPEDFIVEFDAEFFTSENNGYKILDDETEIFRELVENKPDYNLDFDGDYSEIEKHTLSINVKGAPSVPMGSSLSVLFGRNFSFITVELYKDNQYISSKSAVRLPMKSIQDFDNSKIFRTILQSLKYFDWMNLSFFKKAVFSDIDEGKYVVKIFKENSLFYDDRQFIGFATVDLTEDKKINVNCRSEEQISIVVYDQNDNKVENAEIFLKNKDLIITNVKTDRDGEAVIRAPKNSDHYDLHVYYKGILLYENSININSILNLKSDSMSINVYRYTVFLNILDKWGLSPGVDINPILVNNNGKDKIIISSNNISDSNIVFNNIPPGDYNIVFSYKSFIIEEKIKLTDNLNLDIEFPAEYKINIITRDLRGNKYTDSKVFLSRDDKKICINHNNFFSEKVPPGEYFLEVYDNEELVFKNYIDVLGDVKFDFVTNYNPIIPLILLSFFILFSAFIIIFSYLKRDIKPILTFIPIFLILISIIFPWWVIQGASNNIESKTSMFLYPVYLVTITESSQIISGEIAFLPDLFIMVINIFLIITFVGCGLTVLHYLFKNKIKKNNFLILIILTITFIVAISMFIYAINELSTITVGGIIGQGEIDTNIYDGGESFSIYSNWGLGFGFYIYLFSLIMIFLNLFHSFKSYIA